MQSQLAKVAIQSLKCHAWVYVFLVFAPLNPYTISSELSQILPASIAKAVVDTTIVCKRFNEFTLPPSVKCDNLEHAFLHGNCQYLLIHCLGKYHVIHRSAPSNTHTLCCVITNSKMNVGTIALECMWTRQFGMYNSMAKLIHNCNCQYVIIVT